MKIQSLLLSCTLIFSGVCAMENNNAVNELLEEVQNWTPEEEQIHYQRLLEGMPEELRRDFERQQSQRELDEAAQAILNEYTAEELAKFLSTWSVQDDNFHPPFSPIKKTQ